MVGINIPWLFKDSLGCKWHKLDKQKSNTVLPGLVSFPLFRLAVSVSQAPTGFRLTSFQFQENKIAYFTTSTSYTEYFWNWVMCPFLNHYHRQGEFEYGFMAYIGDGVRPAPSRRCVWEWGREMHAGKAISTNVHCFFEVRPGVSKLFL